MTYNKKESVEITKKGKEFIKIMSNSIYGTFHTYDPLGITKFYRKFKIKSIINKL